MGECLRCCMHECFVLVGYRRRGLLSRDNGTDLDVDSARVEDIVDWATSTPPIRAKGKKRLMEERLGGQAKKGKDPKSL